LNNVVYFLNYFFGGVDMVSDYLEVKDINLDEFPKNIHLKYGRGGNREWYEFWHNRKGIVIQRIRPHPYYVFFIDGKVIRTLKLRSGWAFVAYNIKDAVKALEALGFKVIV